MLFCKWLKRHMWDSRWGVDRVSPLGSKRGRHEHQAGMTLLNRVIKVGFVGFDEGAVFLDDEELDRPRDVVISEQDASGEAIGDFGVRVDAVLGHQLASSVFGHGAARFRKVSPEASDMFVLFGFGFFAALGAEAVDDGACTGEAALGLGCAATAGGAGHGFGRGRRGPRVPFCQCVTL